MHTNSTVNSWRPLLALLSNDCLCVAGVCPSPCRGTILLLPMHVVNAAKHVGKAVACFEKTEQLLTFVGCRHPQVFCTEGVANTFYRKISCTHSQWFQRRIRIRQRCSDFPLRQVVRGQMYISEMLKGLADQYHLVTIKSHEPPVYLLCARITLGTYENNVRSRLAHITTDQKSNP